MAKIRNTAEGGTNGTTVTVANSGGASGDAVSAAGGMVYSNTVAAHGSLSIRDTASTSSVLRWVIGGVTGVSVRLYVRFAATPSMAITRITHATDTTAAVVQINTANRLRLNAKSSVQLWVAAADMPLNETIRVEAYFIQGATASSGQARIAYYLGDSTTPIEQSPVITGANFGGDLGTFTQARVGSEVTTNTQVTYYDDIAINTGADSSGFIGPVPPPLPPSPFLYAVDASTLVQVDAYYYDGAVLVPITTP